MPRPQKGKKSKNKILQVICLYAQNIILFLIIPKTENEPFCYERISPLDVPMYAKADDVRTLTARHRLFSVIFSLFVLAGVSPPASQKEKKFLENFSVAGACSFHKADFCHNDKEAEVNTVVFTRLLRKLGRKSAPSKPMRVRISSAMGSIRSF